MRYVIALISAAILASPANAAPTSHLAQAPVRCASPSLIGNVLGLFVPDENGAGRIYLARRSVCRTLRLAALNPLPGRWSWKADRTAYHAWVLAHEAGHAWDWQQGLPINEARADCYGWLHLVPFLRPYTRSRWAARRLARFEYEGDSAPRRCLPRWAR